MLRSFLIAVSVLLGLGSTGCFFGGFNHHDVARNVELRFQLVQDIEVEMDLGYPQNLVERPARIIKIKPEKNSGVEVRSAEVSDRGISFSIRGSKLGTFELKIVYRDDRGNRQKQIFSVQVVELDHTKLKVANCVNSSSRDVILVPAGATISYRGSGYDAEGKVLPIGDLDIVVEEGEFEKSEGTLTAPDEAGEYELTLVGATETQQTIVVYEPDELVPGFSADSRAPDEPATLTVLAGAEIDEEFEAACLLPSELSVDIEAKEGDCRLLVGQLEFEGRTSFALSEGSAFVGLSGTSECSVEAVLSTGGSAEREINVDVDIEESQSRSELALGSEPQEIISVPDGPILADSLGGICTKYSVFRSSVSCSTGFLLQGTSLPECINKTEWWFDYKEFGQRGTYSFTGQGLSTELEILLGVKGGTGDVRDLQMGPTNMTITPSIETLGWESLGCTGHSRIYRLSPTQAGDHDIKLNADNASHEGEYTIAVRAIERSSLKLTDDEMNVPFAEYESSDNSSATTTNGDRLFSVDVNAQGSTRHFFVGEKAAFRLQYFDTDDNRLRGLGPVEAMSSEDSAGVGVDEGSTKERFELYVGDTPNIVELSSPFAPDSHRVVANDEQGIAKIHGLRVAELEEGERLCVTLLPLADDGVLIAGLPPERARVEGVRSSLLVDSLDLGNKTACFVAKDAGSVDLNWSWGSAQSTTTWTVE